MWHLLVFAVFAAPAQGFLSSLFVFNESNCTEKEFGCLGDNVCIPNEKRCNGIYDCKDMSDEEDCDFVLCRDSKFFKCKNGRCVSKLFVCNGENDCEDYSDEEDCLDHQLLGDVSSPCEENEWRCSDRLCILKDWVCNGEADCLDGSDETLGCTLSLSCDGFKCKNNHCVPQEWRCDGFDDCNDNSDEEQCENYINPKDCTREKKRFLCSNNHTCIHENQVCDGTPNCPDGSDESHLCTNPEYSCSKHNCSHICEQLPTGPKCFCPEGYQNINEKECKDINECEIYGICDQKCRNTPGSYECYCDHKYILQDDHKTCKAMGGEAMMVFSTKTQIRSYLLQTKLYFPVASQLKQVVGVAYDGNHIYWTDIFSEHETIVKSLEDGSERQVLITSGLGAPEDLAVDVLTENIYFTDADYKHIGVCNAAGTHCTVLVNKDIRKPRGIALHEQEGEMFWTDWGNPAEIARSNMDGTFDRAFITEDIHWPNGLTIDIPNERLYWTDAKVMTLESVRLDGTDRRIILEAIVKHPYSIAVFENRLYWSDWHTHTIQSCDKFTGKDHHTIIKEKKELIYGLSIYHSSNHPTRHNPCAVTFCSDICLLSGSSYKCACPQNKELAGDQHTCKEIQKRQVLVLAAKNILVHIEHQLLGKHSVSPLPVVIKDIGALAYDPVDNVLFISDIDAKKILKLSMSNGIPEVMNIDDLGKVMSMDYDYEGGNLYWGDQERGTIEILNVKTMARRVLLHDLREEVPESIAVVPETGVMFVAFKRKTDRVSHVDRFMMDGTARTHVLDNGVIGPIDLYYDKDLHRIILADAGTGNIETTSIDGDDRHNFVSLNSNPISIAGLKHDLFWVNEHSNRLYWSNKYNSSYSKRISLESIPDNLNRMHLISVTPETSNVRHGGCSINNGNCSHICIPSHGSIVCTCPNNMMLLHDNQTCAQRNYCEKTEFKCVRSNKCIPHERRCNGESDCVFGEDEADCQPKKECPSDYFRCDDGDCVENHRVCNGVADCRDKSDEHNCVADGTPKCPPLHFRCSDGTCIMEKLVCDGRPDCLDLSDERNCESATCSERSFRCDSGSCIPKSWECDSENDCADMSDEHAGCQKTCDPRSFTCNNGKCVDKLFHCDGTDDCGDNSDEIACDQVTHSGCSHEEFQCQSNGSVCIPMSAVCNGTAECPNREDEFRCSDCQPEEFMCRNKRCVQRSWVCDKVDDCGDGSDENSETCQAEKPDQRFAKIEGHCDGFRCKSGHCIAKSLACNNQHDCYDGSDEGGLCTEACEIGSNPCDHICIKTPSGPTCECRDGYTLKSDGKSCVDVDECKKQPPVCSQICVNSLGSYTCDCYENFEIRSDKTSCKARGEPMTLIFTSNNQIRSLSQKENSLKLVFSQDTDRITGLAFSIASQETYLAIENTGTLLRIRKKDNSKDFISNIGQPKKLALDWVTGNLYYYNTGTFSKSIDVCNFASKSCAPLIKTDLHGQVSNIVVDGTNRVLFYSVVTWFIFNSPKYTIYRTYLDGSGKQVIVADSLGHVTGLTLDLDKRQLYYADQHAGVINRVNYDGTMKQPAVQNVSNSVGLSFFENSLYYLSSGGMMHKAKLYDGYQEEAFKLDVFNGGLFIVAQESIQPHSNNACANHSCQAICVPSRIGSKCLCEDGQFVKENEQCRSLLRSSLNDGRLYGEKADAVRSYQAGSSNTFIVSVFLVMFVLLVAGVGVFYIRKRNCTNKTNVGISFHNATYGISDSEAAKTVNLTPGQHEYNNPIDFDPTELQTTADTVMQKTKPLIEIS